MRGLAVAICGVWSLAACGRVHFDASADASAVDGVDASTLPAGAVFVQEAELGTLVAPFIVQADPEASNGTFVIDDFFESGHLSSGRVTYQLSLATAGAYLIWVRSRAPDTSADSFSLAVDGGLDAEFHTALPNTPDPSWHWIAMSQAIDPYPPRAYQLAAGPHTLVFSSRETLSTLDQIAIASAP